MKITFSQLSKPQQRALIDLVSFGALYCEDSRWCFGSRVNRYHRQSTIKALVRCRLCQIVPTPAGEGAYPTRVGMQLVKDEADDFNRIVAGSGVSR